jgi:hypothetical protein
MPNLNDLGTAPLADAVDVDHLPEQGGTPYPDPPPVGSYRWLLPRLNADAFTKVTTTDYGDRVQVQFRGDFPLMIVQSLGGVHDKEPFQTSISNVPRKRDKEGTVASDWDYLNKALGEPTRPASNRAYAERLIAQSQVDGGKTFGSDLEYSWSCNDTRDAYFTDAEGNQTTMVAADGTSKIQGCGAKYYQSRDGQWKQPDLIAKKAGAVPKEGAVFPVRVQCQCGATIRAFGNLTRFRS